MMYFPQPTYIYPRRFEFHKLAPPQPTPVKIIEAPDGFVTSAEAVYRSRKHLLFTVTLMNGRKGQVVSLKPAKGELYRQPNKLIAVLFDEATGHKSEIEIKAFQPLKVVI